MLPFFPRQDEICGGNNRGSSLRRLGERLRHPNGPTECRPADRPERGKASNVGSKWPRDVFRRIPTQPDRGSCSGEAERTGEISRCMGRIQPGQVRSRERKRACRRLASTLLVRLRSVRVADVRSENVIYVFVCVVRGCTKIFKSFCAGVGGISGW